MIKTQIQILDEMYQRAKRLDAAQEWEWSLAELCRRGIGEMLNASSEKQTWFLSNKPKP